MLNPKEAIRRGLVDGIKVRLRNDQGSIGLVLRVSDEVGEGVALWIGRLGKG